MKVLGLSFGRKMQNCEILVKEALMGAEKSGAEVEFVRVTNLDIGRCIGCGACSTGMRNGKQIRCILKDDYESLSDKVLDADAVIVSAPVYALAPVGQLKDFIDRFGPAHDRAAVLAERNRRKAAGAEPLDARVFKDRYVGYISVGGAKTQNWVSLGLPSMQIFGFSLLMKVVDQVDAYNMGYIGHPALNNSLMERVNTMGKNVADAVGKAYEDVKWMGEEGTCPVCHCNMLTIGKTTDVECPLCGISGKLSVNGDEVTVTFSQSEQNRARSTSAGLLEHFNEIQAMGPVSGKIISENKELLAELLEKYKGYAEVK